MAESPERVEEAGALGILKGVGRISELKPGRVQRFSDFSLNRWARKRYAGWVDLAQKSAHPGLANLTFDYVGMAGERWFARFNKFASCYRKIETDVLSGAEIEGHDKAMYRSFLMFLLAWVIERRNFSPEVAVKIWEGRGLDRAVLSAIVSTAYASPECTSITL